MADEDICDETGDKDWELVGNKEDGLTFATQSVACKSRASCSKAGVAFAKGTKDDSAIPQALKHCSKGHSSFSGREICQWFGGCMPSKRLSICLAAVGG